jgi:paired amphipathic helix protein Sin3a
VGYRIDVSVDPADPNAITVTTPSGTTTQTTNTVLPSGTPVPSSRLAINATADLPAQNQMTAAEHLNNLNNNGNKTVQVEKEFNHAIQYLNKIKARYADDQSTYKQFLDILQTYHKEQRHSHDVSFAAFLSFLLYDPKNTQVYAQVQMLFAEAPDLLAEFKDFLPEAVPPGVGMSIPIVPQPIAGPSSWPQGESPPNSQTKRIQTGNKRSRKPPRPEKESTPVPSQRPLASSSRVCQISLLYDVDGHIHIGRSQQTKKIKQHHTQDETQVSFSPYLGPQSPPPSHAYQISPHMQHALQVELQTNPSAGKLLFFDRAKKVLENREIYEEFLKFLDLFSRDILDLATLVERVKVFFGDGELMTAFKDLVGWDDRDNMDKGPPGSIRTGPPELPSALPVDDGEGPSYRRVPPSVSQLLIVQEELIQPSSQEALLACSGRDQLCRSVLNDEWVSHPTWASEEAGFVVTKKTPFEEALHKSEEERHEYHVQIEALTRTIAVIEPINSRIDEMTNEERANFKLKAGFWRSWDDDLSSDHQENLWKGHGRRSYSSPAGLS